MKIKELIDKICEDNYNVKFIAYLNNRKNFISQSRRNIHLYNTEYNRIKNILQKLLTTTNDSDIIVISNTSIIPELFYKQVD